LLDAFKDAQAPGLKAAEVVTKSASVLEQAGDFGHELTIAWSTGGCRLGAVPAWT
jgi:hypothetical protein